MKRSVMASALLLVALFAGTAWAESIELPFYNVVFKKTTTATFEVPDGWTAELLNKEGDAFWGIYGKIDGTPLEFHISLVDVSRDKSHKDTSAWYAGAGKDETVVDYENSSAPWTYGYKDKNGNIWRIAYYWFVDGARYAVTASFTNNDSAKNESVDTSLKAAEIEAFLKSATFSTADGKPNPTKTKVGQ